MKIVLANGCFDLIHIGHLRYLQEARRMGDMLFVGLTMDSHVNKPGLPIIPQEERREHLLSLSCVSAVILCTDAVDAMRKCHPHIFCKGGDYRENGLLPEEIKYCSENGIEIRFTRLWSSDRGKISSGQIIERIRNG